MINQSVLFQAKAFLCWDKFPNLTIKLIPIKQTVGFFYPLQEKYSTIIIFYDSQCKDFSDSLCLLFHEVGHYVQWEFNNELGTRNEFQKLFNLDKGVKKIEFELDAWIRGQGFLKEFLQKEKIDEEKIFNKYNELKNNSLRTYDE